MGACAIAISPRMVNGEPTRPGPKTEPVASRSLVIGSGCWTFLARHGAHVNCPNGPDTLKSRVSGALQHASAAAPHPGHACRRESESRFAGSPPFAGAGEADFAVSADKSAISLHRRLGTALAV